MPELIFVLPDGSRHGFDAPAGMSLMQAATSQGVAGIVAECGGSGICATCHVQVDASWIERLPPPDRNEHDLLEFVATGREKGSRLACQIQLTPELDGLTVTVPERQY